MNRRLIILSLIIVGALGGLTLLGYHAIERWAEGLQWKRRGEFAEVAEQIRQDVKRKLDAFIRTEEEREYAQYQGYVVAERISAGQREMALLVSPLSGQIENQFAFGYFQIEPDGAIITANDDIMDREGASIANATIYAQTQLNRRKITANLLPALRGVPADAVQVVVNLKDSAVTESSPNKEFAKKPVSKYGGAYGGALQTQAEEPGIDKQQQKPRDNFYNITSLQSEEQAGRTVRQRRDVVELQISANTGSVEGGQSANVMVRRTPPTQIDSARESDVSKPESVQAADVKVDYNGRGLASKSTAAEVKSAEPAAKETVQRTEESRLEDYAPARYQTLSEARHTAQQVAKPARPLKSERSAGGEPADTEQERRLGKYGDELRTETVPVRIGRFKAYAVGGPDAEESIFGGQVYLVRDVQIEERHFRQGFQFNEKRLLKEVEDSARRFIREGMAFNLARAVDTDAAYPVTLGFALGDVFGKLVLNLTETNAGRVARQTGWLRTWYFGIVAVVFLAAALALVSLWRYARAQVKLAQKKDDFISAVSHELRTPLTSIRMYSEMLEKGWVKSEQKLGEYYQNMRQESERLSRLIENVLDFSRIQKGRKKYTFSIGDLNKCITYVVEMMTPYAGQNGFSIRTELEQLGQTSFDNDAVKQIIVNLLDNAIKYARDAEDKTITVRTKNDSQFVFIEVEDHGPGVPHRQRRKIFEEFYRVGSEATRETMGTGLGLALVKRFAESHNGFVEVFAARPAGAVFRVGLAMQR